MPIRLARHLARPVQRLLNRPVNRPVRHRWPTGEFHTVVVCLPPQTQTGSTTAVVKAGIGDVLTLAAAVLRQHRLTPTGVVPHFATTVKWRTSRLVDCWNGLTSGGPLRLLDLAGMRRDAAVAAAATWWLWNEVVRGTRPAQPFWAFTDRHDADPGKYPFARARTEYRSQPRILAMKTFNATPGRVCELPVADLEAFQAGQATYMNLASLAAVPADAVATADGTHNGWLTCTSERLADQLTYLQAANTHIDQLDPGGHLVAMAIKV